MDDNTRDVILGVAGILGTLGGIWLGWILNDRRRHDDVKRNAYANYVGGAMELRVIVNRAKNDPSLAAQEAPMARAVWTDRASISMLAPKAVVDAAEEVNDAFVKWAELSEAGESADEAWERCDREVREAIVRFNVAARADLGQSDRTKP